jgi:hypothetical protein
MEEEFYEDIILPSLAHLLDTNTKEVEDFFKKENKRIPSCLFPSSARYMKKEDGEAIFRTYFHGKSTSLDLPLSSFPERYHSCLSAIQLKNNHRFYSLTSDTEIAVLMNLFE